MKVNGIIAEYNPFHNGHKYQLNEAKKHTNADYTIIAMSGNFMQRGAPAILDKHKRTLMALQNGADLVLELPMYYAVSSAEYFAMGAVTLLDKLGVVTNLCFGSECGNLSVLEQIAHILITEPESYSVALRHNLRQGVSYPVARTNALLQYEPSLDNYRDVFSSPNNILGIEYLKALLRRNSSIVPFTTMRIGSDYHEKRLGENQSSALAIRHAVFGGQGMEFLESQMPVGAYDVMASHLSTSKPMHINDFSTALQYKLFMENGQGFSQYLDVSLDLSDRIEKSIFQFDSFSGFCDLLKSKDMTYTRISRCLLHILLNMKNTDMDTYRSMDYVPYARVLGFRKSATPLLTAIKGHSSIPLITKLADAPQILSPKALQMLEGDIRRNTIYEGTLALKTNQVIRNEYRTPLVII